jgi:hypothetical protein
MIDFFFINFRDEINWPESMEDTYDLIARYFLLLADNYNLPFNTDFKPKEILHKYLSNEIDTETYWMFIDQLWDKIDKQLLLNSDDWNARFAICILIKPISHFKSKEELIEMFDEKINWLPTVLSKLNLEVNQASKIGNSLFSNLLKS